MPCMDLLQIEGNAKPERFGAVVFDAAVSFFRFQVLLLVSVLEWRWCWGWRWCWCWPWFGFGFGSGVGVDVGGTWNLHSTQPHTPDKLEPPLSSAKFRKLFWEIINDMMEDSAPDKNRISSPDPDAPEEAPFIDCAGTSSGNIDSASPVLRGLTHYYAEDTYPGAIQTDPHTLVEQVDAHIASVREYIPGIREDKAKTAFAQVALLLYDKSYNESKKRTSRVQAI